MSKDELKINGKYQLERIFEFIDEIQKLSIITYKKFDTIEEFAASFDRLPELFKR